eukprot:gene17787-32640_t
MFFPLPNDTSPATSTAAAASTAPTLTHMLGGLWADGHPNYQVGTAWTFTNVTNAQPIDSSNNVIWSTVGQVDDGRILHVGWFNVGASALTVPRSITYDSKLQKLLVRTDTICV